MKISETSEKLKPKLILYNNILMYLNKNTRKKIIKILFENFNENGYLITNSLVFPLSDPVEAYYRTTPEKKCIKVFLLILFN